MSCTTTFFLWLNPTVNDSSKTVETILLVTDLSTNSLENLNSDAFEGLKNLKHLDLSYNCLKSIPADLLQRVPRLRTLK